MTIATKTEVTETLEAEYRAATPRSRELFEQSLKATPGGAKGAYYYKPYPLSMERGEGCHVWDADGRKYVDFVNHHTALIVGHRNPAVIEAVERQLDRGIILGAPVGIESEHAEELCRRVKSLDKVRFCNSGTEATLHAVRLARGFKERPKIAKFEGGYHGTHDAVEISVVPPLDQAGPADAPLPVPGVKGMSSGVTEEIVILPYNDTDAVERLVRQHKDELACVLYDPKAGIMPQRPEFAQFVREVTAANDVLLIFDEIVGFSASRGGLQERLGIAPDLTAFGKIVGGGFPVAAFGGRGDIMDLLDPMKGVSGFGQSGTFSAHHLGMAAGHATLKQLTSEAFTHLESLGERLCSGLNHLFTEENVEAQAVRDGSIFSIHFTREELLNYRVMARANKSMAYPIFLSLVADGYYVGAGLGMLGISLPTQETHIDGLIEAVGRALQRLK